MDSGGSSVLNFSGMRFPKGGLAFKRCSFGNADILFEDCDFTGGELTIHMPTSFGGNISFQSSKFKNASLKFSDIRKIRYVDFTNLFSKNSKFEFEMCGFERGFVDFTGSEIVGGFIRFYNCDAMLSLIALHEMEIRNTSIFFNRGLYEKSSITIVELKTGEGDLEFDDLRLVESDLHIDFEEADTGLVSVENCWIDGSLYFNIQDSYCPKLLSLRGTTIDGPVNLCATKFANVPDFTLTRINNHISFRGFDYELLRSEGVFKTIIDIDDVERIQRLKELAVQNGDHGLALRLHADEMRAKRWVSHGKFISMIDLLFSTFSDYGMSIIRPLICLGSIILSFPLLYRCYLSDAAVESSYADLLVLSCSNSLPFIPISREARSLLLDVMPFVADSLPQLYCLFAFQGILSFVLLFLLGLAFRNQFRL